MAIQPNNYKVIDPLAKKAILRRRIFYSIALIFFGQYFWYRLHPHHDFDSPTKITVLIYSAMDPSIGKALDKELEHFRCASRHCVSEDIKKIIAYEYYRHTRKKAKISVNFFYPHQKGKLDLTPPETTFEGIKLFSKLRNEFTKRGQSFFDSDIRLYIDIIGRSRKSMVERSVAAAGWRVGYIEWVAGKTTDDYIWNMTKLAHEIGHTLGATDKYLADNRSVYPEGYVDLSLKRGQTQKYVEIMSGTRPIAGKYIELEAKKLSELRFGLASAMELGWIEKEKLPNK